MRERAVPLSDDAAAGPHPLKMILLDLTRASLREKIKTEELVELLAQSTEKKKKNRPKKKKGGGEGGDAVEVA